MKVVICDHVFPDLEEEKRALACVPDGRCVSLAKNLLDNCETAL